ncbi:MAG: hypothetical protein LQ350_007618 [Teloschistes chrysophthalmus]|nr:MAG: hypothetical protein LQ350_007618 [Niorma chrysophthalma]
MDGPDDWSSDLQDLLAWSLKITASEGQVSTQDERKGSSNPGLRRIIEGILFSRRFILSYQVVLLVLLAIFTLRHWTKRLQVHRRRRRLWSVAPVIHASTPAQERVKKDGDGIDHMDDDDDDESGVSSSSSTVLGSPPSPKGSVVDGERTPLLPPRDSRSSQWRLRNKIGACLMYQPRPIPAVNKTLPSNQATLTVLAFLGLQVFYTFYRLPMSIPTLFVFADRTSLLFVANLPLLYLFAAKNQPIKLLTGYSYESLNIIHRRLGEVMCLLALLHSAGMVGVWYTILRPTGFTLARFLLSKIILLGLGAFVAYEILYFTSLGSFRQHFYELFLVLHVLLQVVALVLVWFHHHNSRPYVGVALAIFLIDRLVYRMILKSQAYRASLDVTEDGGTVVLRSEIPLAQKHPFVSYIAGAGLDKGWKATEHVFLTVPALSHKHMIQAHPFTIASKAPHDGDCDVGFKLIIRAQDGFSGDLVKYARSHSSVKTRIDGPYGSQTALQLLQQCNLNVVVAGGSGIAVALPLIWALFGPGNASDLEPCDKTKLRSKAILIWVIRNENHTSWLDQADLHNLRDAGIEVVIPPPTCSHGHPDVPGMITAWVSTNDMVPSTRGLRTGVVCSGPDGMNREVRNTCASLLARGHDIDVEVEKFGW